MMPEDVDWCAAACADALVEGLTLQVMQAAHDVSNTPEQFFVAVHASIKLKEMCDANRR